MKISKMFFKTYRENPADAEINSHKLLVRAGYIKKQAAGIYVFLPLGIRALHKLTNVIREEMDKAGACETIMSSLLPIEVYASRAEHFGASMFRLTDRTGKEMCLGPSHEEIFAGVVKDAVTSYKQLPITLYQIQSIYNYLHICRCLIYGGNVLYSLEVYLIEDKKHLLLWSILIEI